MRQPHKMVKHTQAIYANELSVFYHFVGLPLKGLNRNAFNFNNLVFVLMSLNA